MLNEMCVCVCGGGKRDVSVTFEYQSIEVKTGRGIMQMQAMFSHFSHKREYLLIW